jgi:CBS domain containing-hemolysin-like protein
MDGGSLLALALVLVFVAANGFFVATELAMVASRRSRLEQMATEGNGGARLAQSMIRRLGTYIAASQMGITMASLALGWVGEPAMAHLIEPPLELVVGAVAPAAAHGVSIAISFAVITTLHIVFGEVVPKRLAILTPEAAAASLARPMQIYEAVFHWPIAAQNGLSNLVLRLLGMSPASEHEQVHSVEELRLMVTGSREAGVVEASEARIATRAFTFADLTAGGLMTPRTEVDAVPAGATLRALLDRVRATPRTQLPVYDGSLDNILGVLHVRDLVMLLGNTMESDAYDQPFDLRALLRPVLVFPESKAADDVLDEMRTARRYFAVVIDEYGGTAGILTLQDLVSALVGPVEEIGAEGSGEQPMETAVRQADGSLLLDGLTRIDEWDEVTGIQPTEDDEEAADTIGGVVMARLGRIPEVGDEVTVGGRTLRVEELDGRRVARVRLLPKNGAAEPALPTGQPGHSGNAGNTGATGQSTATGGDSDG